MLLATCLVALGWAGVVQDTVPKVSPQTIAIVGATIVPMDRERLIPGGTVLVAKDRIVAVGPADSVNVPPGAAVIDAKGRYLAPGLADMHVHLLRERGTSAAFRDGPLYLANGVTTVLNLSGDSIHLAWRAGIERGTLVGPTLYTSGRFVNEPRVNTPDEVEQEIRAQVRAGFDVIKFREVTDADLRPLTTRGLSREAYGRMMETARELSIPLTGHAPNNLGLEAALEDGQSLAHIGYTLLASYFWPRETARFKAHERLGRWASALLGALAVVGWGAAAGAVLRGRRDLARPVAWVATITTLALGAVLLGARTLWDTDRIGQTGRVTAATAAGMAVVTGALVLVGLAVSVWRRSARPTVRVYSVAAALVTTALGGSALLFWIPLVRRSTDGGLTTLARELARSGVRVTTTIQVYRSAEVADDPEVRYVRIPPWWKEFRDPPPRRREWARNLVTFLQRVAGVLHREGVPLLAGTDVMWAYVIPGFALHDELGLLARAGLSPYEVLRTATVEPARFLEIPDEFGTIAAGRRADLVLLDGNPLSDLSTLRRPSGVMARGRWYSASQLEAMLARLVIDQR